MEVAWSPTALRQMVRIFDYLTERNPHAAAEVFEALIDACNRLENLPFRGREVGNDALSIHYPVSGYCRIC